MKYHELQVKANKPRSRVGRGIAAGQGKTAGRGTKGQNSRTGKGRRPGFEGGQNPLLQRLPKLPGFTSHRPKVDNVYTGQLAAVGSKVDNFSLFEAGLIASPHTKVKLIVKGEVAKKHTVKLQAASETAIAMVQKAGGTFAAVSQIKRSPRKTADEK